MVKEDFELSLMEKLKSKKLSDSSINYYLRNLRKLNGNKEIKNLAFLDGKENIDKFLENYKPNTQRNYYITIVSVLSVFPNKKKLYSFYREKMDAMNKNLKIEEGNNDKSDTQKKNWIDQKEIDDVYNKLKNDVDKFKNEKEISKKKYNTLLRYVVLSLYTLVPPRRNKDYQDCYLIKGIPEKEIDDEKNYVDMTNKKFIFNDYKTKKSDGEQIIDIPNDLFNILKIYVKFHPLIELNENTFDVPFLVDEEGIPFPNINSMTILLNKIFKKKIGCSMLRHMYLSNKYGDVLDEMKDDSQKMAHSLSMQKDYIKK